MNINSTLENKLNEVFNESAAIVCSDEYLAMVNNIVNAEPCDSWFIQSTCLVFGEIESIFMDKDNFKYEMKLYNYNNLVNQWERLKYNTELYKQALYKAIEFVTQGKAFIYTLANNTAIAVINVGPDNYIIVPGSEIGPIVRSLYGDLPKHTIPRVVTQPYPNPPGPVTNEDEVQEPSVDQKPEYVMTRREGIEIPPGFKHMESTKTEDGGWAQFIKDLDILPQPVITSCGISSDKTNTILSIVSAHAPNLPITIEGLFGDISCVLYKRFKDNNAQVSRVISAVIKGGSKGRIKHVDFFNNKDSETLGILVTVSYIRYGKVVEARGYLRDDLLEKYHPYLVNFDKSMHTVV